MFSFNKLDIFIKNRITTINNSKNSKATFNIGPSGIPAGWEVIDEVVPEE